MKGAADINSATEPKEFPAHNDGACTYASPLDRPEIERAWIAAAEKLGFRVERTEKAYASSDGRGTILIGARETLDADDSVAQLVMHELCHALVQGEGSWRAEDWGLDNTSDRDDVREEACLRLQAHLAHRFGLRALMTPTTPWRAYYGALPRDPLAARDASERDACALARTAAARAEAPAIATALGEALAATQAIVVGDLARARPSPAPDPLSRTNERGGAETQRSSEKRDPKAVCASASPCEFVRLPSPTPAHPLGPALGPAGETCGTCAWRYAGGRGRAVDRCRQWTGDGGDGRRVSPEWPGCDRWEGALDCQSCGACCREAYHVVSVSVRDPVVWKRPELIVRNGHRFSILRTGTGTGMPTATATGTAGGTGASNDRCAALEVTRVEGGGARYACSIYEDRPQTCRDFARGGPHCLVARRRVGLSAG